MKRKSLSQGMTKQWKWAAISLSVVVMNLHFAHESFGQRDRDFFRRSSVGGIAIDTDGVLSNQSVGNQEAISREMRDYFSGGSDAMQQGTELRMVSLRGLEEAIATALQDQNNYLPEEIVCLAGLQRIEFIMVDPANHDIIIAGPAEGWCINEAGDIVGVTTGHPVMMLDELIVALRSVEAARQGMLSCSIDPTPEGRQNLQAYLDQQRVFNPRVIEGIAQSLGPQQISITGVSPDTRFAHYLVAADFHMKQIAMKLAPSPVPGVSNYIDRVGANVRNSNMMPRWWLACDYEPLVRSEDRLLWRMQGNGIKCMTEEDFIADTGNVEGAGRASQAAQDWADAFNENIEELVASVPSFAHLRNIMDMSVFGALLHHEDLPGLAGCSFPILMDSHSNLQPLQLEVPKTIDTQVSFVKRGRNYIISASGGVQVESWLIASRSEVSDALAPVAARIGRPTDANWWWNPAS